MSADPNTPEPRFHYQILDLMAFMTAIACFLSTIRMLGVVAIGFLPALLIAPSVLAHPENTRAVKVGFVATMVIMTILFYFRAG